LKKDSSLDEKNRDSKGNIFSKLSAERSSSGSPVKKQEQKPVAPERPKIPLLPLPTTAKKVDLSQKMGQSVAKSPVKVLPPSSMGGNQRSYQDETKNSPSRPKPPAEIIKTSPSFSRSEFSKNKSDSRDDASKPKPKEAETKKDNTDKSSDSSGKSTPTKESEEGSKSEFRAPTPKFSKSENKDSKKEERKDKQPKSPKSSPSSPEDNLIIDCQPPPKIIAKSPVSRSSPATSRESPPIIASPKVDTPTAKSPTESPKDKKASITPVQSPCEIDDDLMDVALMGPSSE